MLPDFQYDATSSVRRRRAAQRAWLPPTQEPEASKLQRTVPLDSADHAGLSGPGRRSAPKSGLLAGQ
jgi:hypothetical protein